MVTLQATTGGALQVQGLLNVAGRRERVATVRSMNRAVSSGRTLLVSLVARATGLKSADVRKAIHTTNATIAAARAELAPSPRPIPLIKFGAKGPVPSRGKGRG